MLKIPVRFLRPVQHRTSPPGAAARHARPAPARGRSQLPRLTALGAVTLLAVAPAGGQPPGHQMQASRTSGAASPFQGDGSRSGVSGGALFGGDQNLVPDERQLGRRLRIVRVYTHIGDHYPRPLDTRLMKGGRTLLISLDSNGRSYASIAAGTGDKAIRTFLTAVNHSAVRYHLTAIYVSFEHEPDNPAHHRFGTPAQFVRAWDHVHRLAASAHLDWNDGGRLHWAWIMIRTSFGHRWTSRFWPGSKNADIIAVDGYNASGCSGGKSPSTPAKVFGPALAFAAAHGHLPVFLSEWGSTNVPAGTQARYIAMMRPYIATHTQIAAALYWNTSDTAHCNFSINNSRASVRAMIALARSTALRGHLRPLTKWTR